MPEFPPSMKRVHAHIERLRMAGLDTQKFHDALVEIRDDRKLERHEREALYKLVAMESYIWYLEAIRNEPIDREAMTEEVKRLYAEQVGDGPPPALPTTDASDAPTKAATPRKKPGPKPS